MTLEQAKQILLTYKPPLTKVQMAEFVKAFALVSKSILRFQV